MIANIQVEIIDDSSPMRFVQEAAAGHTPDFDFRLVTQLNGEKLFLERTGRGTVVVTVAELCRAMLIAGQAHDDGGWTPLTREDHLIHRETGERIDIEEGIEAWANDIYTVMVRREPEGTHLSFHRKDQEPAVDWRDKQRIKNQICGEDAEGLELFPAEDRVVDMANQFHLWVLPAGIRIPVGFEPGSAMILDTADSAAVGATQRPLEADDES